MNEILQVIENAQARYRIIRRKRAWLAAFAAFVLVMALAALLDRTWMFSGWARWAGWGAALVAAAVAARCGTGAACPDAMTLAHRIEAEAGETVPVVATAIDPAVRRLAEKETLGGILLERLDRRATETMKAGPLQDIGRLRGAAGLAVAAVAAVAALLAIQGGSGLLRMMFPWRISSYTSLALEGPAEALAEGRPFTLTAQVRGVPVGKVTLYRVDSTVPLAEAAPDRQGMVRLTVAGLDGPAEFVARGGDGRSAALRVEIYPLPRIGAFEISVRPPAYVAEVADTVSEPSFPALRGSRLRYRLHLKAPAAAVRLERAAAARKEERETPDERKTPGRTQDPGAENSAVPVFRPDPADPLVWEAEWELPSPEAIVYRITIEGARGDLVRNEQAWRINVLPDAPPSVRILGHNGSEVIKTGKEEVRFDLGAVDDIRLAKARLVFRKPGSPYSQREIALPAEPRRTWTGAEMLALLPLDLAPLDIVAVHAEVEDSNTLDGPGVGRSEVVFLEVPLPEADGGDDGGGGGGGGGSEPINPLELQKEILRATLALSDQAPASERQALANDQRQNAEYAGMIARAAAEAGAEKLAGVLLKAQQSMASAARTLDANKPDQAVPAEEAALGALVEAAQLLEDPETGLPMGEMSADSMTFTLRPSPPKSSKPKESQDDKGQDGESLSDLIAKVKKQLAEQEGLNESLKQAADKAPADDGKLAERQQALSQEARAAAGQARGMKASPNSHGDPKAASEDLDQAAELQDSAAEALAEGDGKSSKLGEQSAEALKGALHELTAKLKGETDEGEAHPPGYERLISDYLRSISYE